METPSGSIRESPWPRGSHWLFSAKSYCIGILPGALLQPRWQKATELPKLAVAKCRAKKADRDSRRWFFGVFCLLHSLHACIHTRHGEVKNGNFHFSPPPPPHTRIGRGSSKMNCGPRPWTIFLQLFMIPSACTTFSARFFEKTPFKSPIVKTSLQQASFTSETWPIHEACDSSFQTICASPCNNMNECCL